MKLETQIRVEAILMSIFVVLFAFIKAFAITFVVALPVWLIWNWLMPTIFGLAALTYIQTVGILIMLCLVYDLLTYSTKKSNDANDN